MLKFGLSGWMSYRSVWNLPEFPQSSYFECHLHDSKLQQSNGQLQSDAWVRGNVSQAKSDSYIYWSTRLTGYSPALHVRGIMKATNLIIISVLCGTLLGCDSEPKLTEEQKQEEAKKKRDSLDVTNGLTVIRHSENSFMTYEEKVAWAEKVEKERIAKEILAEQTARREAEEKARIEAENKAFAAKLAESEKTIVLDLKKQAEEGIMNAQYDLGVRYVEGKGVEKNREEGIRLLKLAAEQQDGRAKIMLRELAKAEKAAEEKAAKAPEPAERPEKKK